MSKKEEASEELEHFVHENWQVCLKPFSITALSQIFKLDKLTVRKRLVEAEVAGKGRGDAPLYYIREAAPYLVKPKLDIAATLKSMRTQDMPVHIRKEFWQAKESELRYKTRAGELWHTQDVIAVFGKVFSEIRDSLQTWDNTLDQATSLTDGQRKLIRQMLFGLQENIHVKLVELPQSGNTSSVLLSDDEVDNDVDAIDESLYDNDDEL